VADNVGLVELLHEEKRRLGSVRRLAERLDVSERTANDWLKRTDDEELRRVRQEHKERIVKLALDLDIEPERFACGPLHWDIKMKWDENLSWNLPAPPRLLRPFASHSIDFLGQRLNSPIGVWSSPFTASAARVKYFAASGADVLTYKTVRSEMVPAKWPPNVYFVATGQQALSHPIRGIPEVEVTDASEPSAARNGVVARFGYPSTESEFWQADFRAAQQSLAPGQMLVLSVKGTCCSNDPFQTYLDDWTRICALAVEAGAGILELDMALPIGPVGDLICQPSSAAKVCKAARRAAPGAKVLINIGFATREQLQELVKETAGSGFCDGFTLSTVPARPYYKTPYGKEFLSNGEAYCLAGPPTVGLILQCAGELRRVCEKENLPRIGIVIGSNVSSEQEFTAALHAGADVVQVASACFFDSHFPFKLRKYYDSQVRHSGSVAEDERDVTLINFTKAIRRLETELALNLQGRDRLTAAAQEEMLSWLRRVDSVSSVGALRAKPAPSIDDCVRAIQARLLQR